MNASGTPRIALRTPGGARLEISPSRGFNAFSWEVEWGGRTVSVLWSDKDFPGSGTRATASGIPILFPFAGRIGQARFEWRGSGYELPDGDGMGNAIHGAVFDRPWSVIEQGEDRVTGRFIASRDWPDGHRQWPADFCLECTYELRAWELVMRFTIRNESSAPLPCGLGIHPYFSVDLDVEGARLRLPARRRWELEGLVPTGRSRPWSTPAGGLRLARTVLDDVVSEWESSTDAWQRIVLERGADHPDVTVRFRGGDFPFGVVYTPPHRRALCIEPYSCLPNAFALAAQGIETGMWVLQPGAVRTTEIAMTLGESGETGSP